MQGLTGDSAARRRLPLARPWWHALRETPAFVFIPVSLLLTLIPLGLGVGMSSQGASHDTAWYMALSAALGAALAARYLRGRPQARTGALLAAAVLLTSAIARGPVRWITEERVLYTLLLLDGAGVFTFGALGLTQPLRASPELRVSVLGSFALVPVVAASPLLGGALGR